MKKPKNMLSAKCNWQFNITEAHSGYTVCLLPVPTFFRPEPQELPNNPQPPLWKRIRIIPIKPKTFYFVIGNISIHGLIWFLTWFRKSLLFAKINIHFEYTYRMSKFRLKTIAHFQQQLFIYCIFVSSVILSRQCTKKFNVIARICNSGIMQAEIIILIYFDM